LDIKSHSVCTGWLFIFHEVQNPPFGFYICTMRIILFLSCLACLPFAIQAQTLPTKELDSIVVKDMRWEVFLDDEKNLLKDSIFAGSFPTLAGVLEREGDFFIKNYGPSGLSTVSARGADASHTLLVWNGINLQNSMNGVTDFSLIDPMQFSSVGMHSRGSSSLFGTAAIGGVIFLNNESVKKKGWSGQGNITAGSFGMAGSQGKLQWKGERYGSDFSFAYLQARNDFPIPGGSQRRTNAGQQLLNLHQNNYFQLSETEKLSTHFWYQQAEREIPSTVFASHFEDLQKDKAIRMAATYKKIHQSGISTIRTAWLQEYNYFDNNLISPSDNLVKSFIAEAEHMHAFGPKARLNLGANFTHNQAISSNYENNVNRNQIALFSQLQQTWNPNWETLASLRGTHITDLQITNISGEIVQYWKPGEHTSFGLSMSRNFKAPTFNDLYWPASGNTNLLPEEGYNFEASSLLHYKIGSWQVHQEVDLFSNHIQNWIQWIPAPPNGLFRPVNHKYVWSRGLAIDWSAEKRWDKWQLETGWQYNYTKSTVEKTSDGNREKLGKQLIYVPAHTGRIHLQLKYGRFGFSYFQNLTGQRYTDPLNQQEADAFTTGDFSLTYSHILGKQKDSLHLTISINNIWNAEYEVVAFYPMPPRAFRIQAGYRF
jgi:vitamin B12 transporter